MTNAPALVWTEEPREGRGPAFIATSDGTKIGFVSDRGEEHAGPDHFRWKVWGPEAGGGDCDTLEAATTALEAEWARVNEEQPA